MILFSASSNSKFGVRIPLIEHEDFRSSTDSTISTSLFHSKASVGNCEQVHTSVLNLIFRQANVVGVGKLSKWRSEIWSLLLVCPIILWESSLTRVEWISGWRSWLASRIQGCVFVFTLTRYMRWCVLRYVRDPRIESSSANSKYRAAYRCGSAIFMDHDKVEVTLVDW